MAGCGGALENRRDLLDLVKLARGDLHDQIVGLVISERQAAAVQPAEAITAASPSCLSPSTRAWLRASECSSAAALASKDG